jgi:dethiobiotin synthetase
MRNLGFNCGYYKPALSGAIRQSDGSLLAGDCDFVLKTAGLDKNPLDCVSYCFEEAVSPHLAANRQGVVIEPSKILSDFNKISKEFDFMVVEGAGGITCPFNLDNKTLLLSDVIKTLDLDILIVADGGLGTINSVLLTVEYAKSHNLNIRGIIFNNYDSENFMHRDNLLQVERLTGVNVIATVQKGAKDLDIKDENLLKIFEK